MYRGSAGSAFSQANDTPLFLAHANVVDVTSGNLLRDATVEVIRGKINRVSREAITPPAGATVIDIKGKYLLPGLIDAHVHIRDRASAKRALESGVTTARSMGGAHFTDIGMRELTAAGVLEGPESLAAGYHMRWRPDDAFFFDHPELVELGMTPLQALQAATVTAAELLQVDDHTGRIATGLDADLLVVERDPLLIVNNGTVIVNRLAW